MISVVTPVYNGDRFIEFCIKNVIEQNCPDMEHIIVDGGSSDRTVEIIQRYAEQYPHIRWISERDQGQSDAMNKGIQMAKGEILSFLNVDDFYEPNILNKIDEIFKGLPTPSLVVGNCNIWHSEEHISFVNKPKRLKFTDLLLGHTFNPFPMNPSAYFYHTCLHEQIGLYDLNQHYTLDIDFLLRAARVAHTKYIDEIWGNHLQIEGTKTVDDIKNGTSSARIEYLIKHYRKDLDLPQRLWVSINYEILKLIDWNRVRYFSENPKNIVLVIKKKLKH